MRIVADVNVLISATIAPLGASRAIVEAWRHEQIELVVSEPILGELEAKLRSTRIGARYRITTEEVRRTLGALRTQAELILIPTAWIRPITGDPEDDAVLATAAIGNVEYLVTGDHGLLDLGSHMRVQVISPRRFLTILQGGASS
ncbi:MAG: uncharacterized protein QOF51_3849 [Chloroflexota bacterium]|jgi:putative PIN family toxin of toxin-antitoxin system|nr:uncharacterized protein [Chloroflexota bacterium]